MRRIARILLRVAVLLLAIFLLLGIVPTRGLAVEYVRPNKVVNCGSFFSSNEWTNDAGCEKSILARMAWMGGALALTVLSALVAVILFVVAHDREQLAARRAVLRQL
jgi:hypothetical protein